jgi:prephenate dehydrogenase
MPTLTFNQVTVIGLGLLGGSFARDVRRLGLAEKIVGVARSGKTAKIALEQGIVDEIQDLQPAVKHADLVLVATPMLSIGETIEKIATHVSEECIITDVGSVKRFLYDDLKARCPEVLSSVVLAHPIAGGERSGALASKHGLFDSKHLILTPTVETNQEKLRTIETLWQLLGSHVVNMSLDQHDAVFAKTSHLPHVVAFALVNHLQSQQESDLLFDMAAGGFYDFTRIASSDAVMWRDICLSNSEQISDSLSTYITNLQELKQLLDSKDATGLESRFSQAKQARDNGLRKKSKK